MLASTLKGLLSILFVFCRRETSEKPWYKADKLKEFFKRNVAQIGEKSMNEIIKEIEDHFTLTLVVDSRKINERVIPVHYPIPRVKN